MAQVVTRFAPSPTGPLHLGHAYAALVAHDLAMRHGGIFLVRIEDIDQSRARPAWEAQIFDDLRWLGLTWSTPVMRQSDRLPNYRAALQALWERRLLYPCTCTRRDIAAASSAPQEGAMPEGPDGLVYPGTCRGKVASRQMDAGALRLLMADAAQAVGGTIAFTETGHGPDAQTGRITLDQTLLVEGIGDVVLARPEMGTSYHLAVVIDDAEQGVTHVTRGQDLFDATAIHVLLQRLLGLPVPIYHHHRLIRDPMGKRLAKRDDARALQKYRQEGATPADIRRLAGL